MPLITEREAVLAVYRNARERSWVVPTFCTENATTVEAILEAARVHGARIGEPAVPVTIAVTNRYEFRSQAVNYSHTRQWEIGMRLFLADLRVLTAPPSPFSDLAVMVHLDHIQPDLDADLLAWDLRQFSSIMYDASAFSFAENIARTQAFMAKHGHEVVVEGACDEIAGPGEEVAAPVDAEMAARYARETGVDFLVVNLGTEHRSSASTLAYNSALARDLSARVGPCLVMHGCSSVRPVQLSTLAADGVCKVNIWTVLERDSSALLLAEMLRHAGQIAGEHTAADLQRDGLLGPIASVTGPISLDYCTTTYRQHMVFEAMRDKVLQYLVLLESVS